MTFYWWDDAVAHAISLTKWTLIRHRVFHTAGGWTVDLADNAVLAQVEVCS